MGDDVKTLYESGVVELAAAIAAGEVTPLEIVEGLLARVDQYDDKVRAFSYLDREAVLAEAKVLTEEAAAGQLRGPLHGVPFGVKEQFLVKDVPTLAEWKDSSPDLGAYDATLVTRLRDAGALLVGKLFMVGVGGSGTPPTRNPWNLEATPGGSSSGSGAAVGARYLPFTLSEQTAGSGIRPAAYNGVSGFKPTYGRNPRYGMFQLAYSFDHPCIIATTMEDIAAVFAVTGGVDVDDPSSVVGPVVLEKPLSAPPRIGVIRNFFPQMIEPEMAAAIESAVAKLKAAGAEVVDFELSEEFGMVFPLNMLIGAPEAAVISMRNGEKMAAKGIIPNLKPPVTSQTRFSRPPASLVGFLPATYYVQAQRVRRWLADKVDASMTGFDAILTATAPGAAPLDTAISGDPTLLTPWSTVGNPTTSIPGGLDSNGLPLGLQLISPRMSDEHLLATSAWCEDVIGRLPAPPMNW
ncbi:MAG: amidase [Pseudonocardiales bacterium]|nr:amidase [Pseudonocardiales bacterium]